MLVPFWAERPAHMLGKVAEAFALRAAFTECAGIYTREELSTGQIVNQNLAAGETSPETSLTPSTTLVAAAAQRLRPGHRRPAARLSQRHLRLADG